MSPPHPSPSSNNNQLQGAQGSSSSNRAQLAEASAGPSSAPIANNDQMSAALGPIQDAALANSAQHNNNQQQQGANDDNPPLPFPVPLEAGVVMMDAGAPMQGLQQGGGADVGHINVPLLMDNIAVAAVGGMMDAEPGVPAANPPANLPAPPAAAQQAGQQGAGEGFDVATLQQLAWLALWVRHQESLPSAQRVQHTTPWAVFALLLDYISCMKGHATAERVLRDGGLAAAAADAAAAAPAAGAVTCFHFLALPEFPELAACGVPATLVLCWPNEDDANQARNTVHTSLHTEGYIDDEALELLPTGQQQQRYGHYVRQVLGENFDAMPN